MFLILRYWNLEKWVYYQVWGGSCSTNDGGQVMLSFPQAWAYIGSAGLQNEAQADVIIFFCLLQLLEQIKLQCLHERILLDRINKG